MEFLYYFDKLWMNNKIYHIHLWNYSKLIKLNKKRNYKYDEKLFFTNYALESLNAILNYSIGIEKVSVEKFNSAVNFILRHYNENNISPQEYG